LSICPYPWWKTSARFGHLSSGSYCQAQAIDHYGVWAGKEIKVQDGGWPGQTLWIKSPYSLTTNEALELIEALLRREAHVILTNAADGSLWALKEVELH
jgi:hypothetical protein